MVFPSKLMLSEQEISKIGDPAERIYQRCNNILHGKATITATVTHRGGGSVPRTTEYSVSAISGDVLAEVVVKDNVEWRLQSELSSAWKKARRKRDLDVFKREVVQRSGGAITPEVAQQWAAALNEERYYPKYLDLMASYMSKAVQAHQ